MKAKISNNISVGQPSRKSKIIRKLVQYKTSSTYGIVPYQPLLKRMKSTKATGSSSTAQYNLTSTNGSVSVSQPARKPIKITKKTGSSGIVVINNTSSTIGSVPPQPPLKRMKSTKATGSSSTAQYNSSSTNGSLSVSQPPRKPIKIGSSSIVAIKNTSSTTGSVSQPPMKHMIATKATTSSSSTQPNGVIATKRSSSKRFPSYPTISTHNLPILTASPPLPPNWHERYHYTITSLAIYKLFPVDPITPEYATIAELLSPATVSTVEQIVNPTLWSRFVNTRKDMIKSKSADFDLLSKLQLNEEELITQYEYSFNFQMNRNVANAPYSDNMALLFHCTRNSANIEPILLQGLDERMFNIKGLLGRGIYFSDNPQKSITYDGCGGIIFIFAVLLGDCFSCNQPRNDLNFVREPEKLAEEKRNVNDLFFDSVIAQPSIFKDNEYIIYNRYQCCPLYKIQFSPGTAKSSDIYLTSRKCLPTFSWISESENEAVLNPLITNAWPFYAETLFAKMKSNGTENEKMKYLADLGFHDAVLNLETLKKHHFNITRSVNYLLDQRNQTS